MSDDNIKVSLDDLKTIYQEQEKAKQIPQESIEDVPREESNLSESVEKSGVKGDSKFFEEADKFFDALGYDEETNKFVPKKFNNEKTEDFINSYDKNKRLEICQDNLIEAYNELSRKPNLKNQDKLFSIGKIYREIINEDESKEIDVFDLDNSSYTKIKPVETEWLVDNIIPLNTMGLFVGKGGVGKSRAALMLAVAVASGDRQWMHGFEKVETPRSGCNCAYVTWEDPVSEVRKRGMANPKNNVVDSRIGNNLRIINFAKKGHIFAPAKVGELPKITKAGEELREYCEDNDIKFLVLDTLAAAFGANENDRVHARSFITSWNDWAQEAGVTIMIIAHPPKNEADYSGSTDWRNGPRWMISLNREYMQDETQEEIVVLKVLKNSYGKPDRAWRLDNWQWWQAQEIDDIKSIAPTLPKKPKASQNTSNNSKPPATQKKKNALTNAIKTGSINDLKQARREAE